MDGRDERGHDAGAMTFCAVRRTMQRYVPSRPKYVIDEFIDSHRNEA